MFILIFFQTQVVSAMVGNDLMSFVSTWPLSSWKENLALLCTVSVFDTLDVLQVATLTFVQLGCVFFSCDILLKTYSNDAFKLS